MKRINLKVAVCLLAGSFLFSSCFVGKYGLWNKYISWQNNMTNNKYVNAIVGLILVPIVGRFQSYSCQQHRQDTAGDGSGRPLLCCYHPEERL